MCRYKLPKELSEYKLVCAAVQKPLFLLALLHSLQGQSTIVFTASVEATHRWAVLPYSAVIPTVQRDGVSGMNSIITSLMYCSVSKLALSGTNLVRWYSQQASCSLLLWLLCFLCLWQKQQHCSSEL